MISDDLDQLKKSAATEAAQFIRNGMVVGLGTGSTAKHMIRALGEKVRAGMNLRGIPTSQETAALAKQAGIPSSKRTTDGRLTLPLTGPIRWIHSSISSRAAAALY